MERPDSRCYETIGQGMSSSGAMVNFWFKVFVNTTFTVNMSDSTNQIGRIIDVNQYLQLETITFN
jgi:hypothetical protein